MHPRRTHPDAARRLALIAAGAAPPEPAADADTGANRPAQPAEPAEAWWADHTRIALPAAPAVPADPAAPAGRVAPSAPSARSAPRAPALPVPGRHAARRRLLPSLDRLRDAAPSLGPAHVAVVALVVALGLAGTAWWVVRAEAGPSVVPVAGEGPPALVTDSTAAALAGAPSAATPTAGAAPTVPSAGPASGASVTVDVAGKVRRPGIVVLPPGTRVVDALRAAGSARPGVDTTALNLARVLVDGEQIVVGGPAPPAGGSAAAAAPPGTGPAPVGPLVNLNQAGQAELETLPQVGPVTAQAIIAWREQRGGFTSVDELLEVDGIGEKTLARLAPHVTV